MWRQAAELVDIQSEALAEIVDATRRDAARSQPPANAKDSILDDIESLEFISETMQLIADEDYDDHEHAPKPYDPWRRIEAISKAVDALDVNGITQEGADNLARAVDTLAAMFD